MVPGRVWGAHLQPAGRRMPGCWLRARAEEHRLAAVELIREKGGGGGNWQTRKVGRAKRLMPRAASRVWVGDGLSWLLGGRVTSRAYLHLPDRQTGPRGPSAGFYQAPPAARDQATSQGFWGKASS